MARPLRNRLAGLLVTALATLDCSLSFKGARKVSVEQDDVVEILREDGPLPPASQGRRDAGRARREVSA